MSLPQIKADEALRLIRAGAVLVDVREPFEHQTARIEGAEFIPMRQIPEHVGSPTLPKDKHLLIHCHHGGCLQGCRTCHHHHGRQERG